MNNREEEKSKNPQKTLYEKRFAKITRIVEKCKMFSPLLAENILLHEITATYKRMIVLNEEILRYNEKIISSQEKIIEAYKRKEKEQPQKAA